MVLSVVNHRQNPLHTKLYPAIRNEVRTPSDSEQKTNSEYVRPSLEPETFGVAAAVLGQLCSSLYDVSIDTSQILSLWRSQYGTKWYGAESRVTCFQ